MDSRITFKRATIRMALGDQEPDPHIETDVTTLPTLRSMAATRTRHVRAHINHSSAQPAQHGKGRERQRARSWLVQVEATVLLASAK
jgi:hypothetical protein